MTRSLVLVALLAGSALLAAQSTSPLVFDAVSIREVDPGTSTGTTMALRNGNVQALHIRASNLISIAHEIDLYRVVNAPEWATRTYYDVQARANAATTRPQIFEMMRTMLAERFSLKAHRETRDLDGFALVRASPSLGPGLKASAVNCEDNPRGARCAEGQITATSMRTFGIPIASIVKLASGFVVAPIVDRTGLTGTFDVELRWSTDASTDDAPVLPTALQEQLGLKLQRERVPTEVLVIDRVERASEN